MGLDPSVPDALGSARKVRGRTEGAPGTARSGEAPASRDWAETTAMFIQLTAFIFS